MSVVSRADLVRLFNNHAEESYQSLADILGYKYTPNIKLDPEQGRAQPPEINIPSQPVYYSRGLPSVYWVVESIQVVSDSTSPKADSYSVSVQQKPEQSLSWEMVPHSPVWQTGQWQNCWDKALPGSRDRRKLDVRKSVRLLSTGRPVAHFPRKQGRSYNRKLVLILERSEQVRPVWKELRDAYQSLLALFGEERMDTFYLQHGPSGKWKRPDSDQCGGYMDIEEGAAVVLVGAFGTHKQGRLSAPWAAMIQKLTRRSHQLLVIPAAPISQTQPSYGNVQVLPLDHRPSKRSELLLSAITLSWRPVLEQLRMLRLAIPEASLADELTVWQSQKITRSGSRLQIKEDELILHLQRLQAQTDLKQEIEQVVKDWQQFIGYTAREIEHLQGALLERPTPADYKRLSDLVEKSAVEGIEAGSWAFSILTGMLPLCAVLARTDASEDWQDLLRVAQQVAKYYKKTISVKQKRQNAGEKVQGLVQAGRSLQLRPDLDSCFLKLGQDPYCLQTGRPFSIEDNPSELFKKLSLIDQAEIIQLNAIKKPDWAERIWNDREGLFAAHAEGSIFCWQPRTASGSDDDQLKQSNWQLVHNSLSWASEIGIDQYGLWADLQVNNASYRLRWIPPGRFVMGSPEGEEGRTVDEIQHKVTISRGFWLGERSCTQAFWQAVMENNPSISQAAELPVNNVSWHDCQKFIRKLHQLVPVFLPQLPTEAQWEYACRSGSEKAYWWGDVFDNKFANKAPQLRDERDYPASPFGLRSMSGNVNEWCADLYGDYSNESVTDPQGVSDGTGRVLRGGYWGASARYLRSAYRGHGAPDGRYRGIGLRLAGGLDPQAGSSGWMLTADRRERSDAGQRAGSSRED